MTVFHSAHIKHALTNSPVKTSALVLSLIATAWLLHTWLAPDAHTMTPPPVRVVIAKVEQRDIPRYLTAIGTVQSPHSVTITPQVDGELKALHFQEGHMVKRGQLLAEIDDRRIRANLAQARAEKRSNEALLKTATTTLKRYENLVKEDAINAQMVDQQAAEVARLQAVIASADAAITNAEVQLDYTQIKSPITGRAGIRRIDAGNIVRANDTHALVTITQLQPIEVSFALPQDHLPELQTLLSQTAAARSTSPTTETTIGQVITRARANTTILDIGHLHTLDNQVDAATGTIALKARFTNEKQTLWPGQFVTTELCVDIYRQAIVVPTRAIMRGREKPFVFRIHNDQAEAVDVHVIYENDQYAVIDSTLTTQDNVVVDGQLKLKNGTAVTVTNPSLTPSASSETP